VKRGALYRWLCAAALWLLGIAVLVSAAGCTVVRYTDGQKSVTVADVRISGSAIDLHAVLNDVGSLEVNRDQGTTQGIVEAVADAVDGPL